MVYELFLCHPKFDASLCMINHAHSKFHWNCTLCGHKRVLYIVMFTWMKYVRGKWNCSHRAVKLITRGIGCSPLLAKWYGSCGWPSVQNSTKHFEPYLAFVIIAFEQISIFTEAIFYYDVSSKGVLLINCIIPSLDELWQGQPHNCYTYTQMDTQTNAGNDNTWRSKLAFG